jgi:hypothetical protein
LVFENLTLSKVMPPKDDFNVVPVEALDVPVAAVADEVFTVAVDVVSDDPLSEPQPLNMGTNVTNATMPISFFFPDCI